MSLLDTLISRCAPDIQPSLCYALKISVSKFSVKFILTKFASIIASAITKGLDAIIVKFVYILPNDKANAISGGFAQQVQTDFATFGVTLNLYVQSQFAFELDKKQFGRQADMLKAERDNLRIKIIKDFNSLINLVHGKTLLD